MIKSIKERQKIRGDIFEKSKKFYKKIDEIIKKIKPLDKIKTKLQLKYGVINSNTENQNKIKAIKTIIYISIFTLLSIIVEFKMMGIWYLVIPVAIVTMISPYALLFFLLNMKLSRLREQFPEAVNIFITKYTSEKNKERALQNTYLELQNPIRYEFRRLSTMIANQSNITKAIANFCKRVDYVWAEMFGELLVLNHTIAEDIGDELNEFSLLMAEDQALETHRKTEVNGTKAINIIVAVFAVFAVLFNLVLFKSEAVNIYFERYIGIASISIGIVTIALSLLATFYIEKN